MFVDEHLAERCLVCCFLGVLAYGLRLTNVQRTAILLVAFWVCEGCFGLFIIFMVANTSDGCR
jgi:hypothetical protein